MWRPFSQRTNMADANQKGIALERATRAIEEMVIRAQPGLSDAPFSIEPRAKLQANKRPYEIDVLVRINEGSPYETMHFFECKNWKKPVDRTAVTVFADKMRLFGAARGTIVGRSFTEDAKAKSQETPNLELAVFTEDLWLPLSAIKATGMSHHFERLQVMGYQPLGTPMAPPNWNTSYCILRGKLCYFPQLAADLATDWLRKNDLFHGPMGDHVRTATLKAEFFVGDLTVGDCPIQFLMLAFDYVVTLRPPRLISMYSIEKRGRFARLEFEPDAFDGKELAFEITGPP